MSDMLLHVLPQYDNHTSVMIYGTPDAMKALHAAIDRVINTADDAQSDTVFTKDGEGYHVEVIALSAEEMNAIPLPYAQLGHSWDFPEWAEFDALKAENERLRGVIFDLNKDRRTSALDDLMSGDNVT